MYQQNLRQELHEEETVLGVSLEYQPAKCEFISASDGEGQPLDDISTLAEFVPTSWDGGRGYGAPPLLPGIFTAWIGGAWAFNESGDFYYYVDGVGGRHNGDPGGLNFKGSGSVTCRIWGDYVRFNFCWQNGKRLTLGELAAAGITHAQAISRGYEE